MIQCSNYPGPSLRAARPAPTPPAPAPSPSPEPPEHDDNIGDCLEKIGRKVLGVVVGTVFGTSGLVANAAAGGAEGVVHGARLGSHQKPAFYTAMTANLAVAGALGGGPVGAGLGLAGGYLLWGIQGGEVRDKVCARSDTWVDKVLSKLPGNPDQAGLPRRIANAAIGDVVGAGAGAVAGTFGLFLAGQSYAENIVSKAAQHLRGHG